MKILFKRENLEKFKQYLRKNSSWMVKDQYERLFPKSYIDKMTIQKKPGRTITGSWNEEEPTKSNDHSTSLKK